jgi:hypothetical protein
MGLSTFADAGASVIFVISRAILYSLNERTGLLWRPLRYPILELGRDLRQPCNVNAERAEIRNETSTAGARALRTGFHLHDDQRNLEPWAARA